MTRTRAFTLIELLVTLSILSMVTALVFPNLRQLLGSVERTTDFESIVMDFNMIGQRVRDSRADVNLSASTLQRFVAIPVGWEMSFEQPIVYRASGACLGGHVTIKSGGNVMHTQRLESPRCRIQP
jgi:general secretion pathway protein G